MKFDENFLTEMGLSSMPEDQKHDFLNYLQDELEILIGQRISNGLSETQLNEFDGIVDKAVAREWLEKNRPDFREIVEQSVQEMKAEIAANREKLLT